VDAAQILRLEKHPTVTIKFVSAVDGQPSADATMEYDNLFANLQDSWKMPEAKNNRRVRGLMHRHLFAKLRDGWKVTEVNNDCRVRKLTHRHVEGAVIDVRCETGRAILLEVAKALESDPLKDLVKSLWKEWNGDIGRLPSWIVFEGFGKDSPNGRVRVRLEVPAPVADDEIMVWVGRFHNRFNSILKPMDLKPMVWVAPPRKATPSYHDLVWAAAAGQVRELVCERFKFEQREAVITDAYWPHHKKIGAAVMVRRWSWRHPLRFREQVRLERITGDVDVGDWLGAFQQIDELAVRAHHALRGMSQRSAVYRLFSVASQIYRRFDVDDQEKRRSEYQRHELKIQKQQCKLLSDISNFIDQAAKREAKVVYVGGMGFGIIALALLLGLTSIVWSISDGKTSGVNRSILLGCAIVGAFGAIVSVLTQIRHIEVNAEVGRGYVRLLGGMRPFIGAIFGAVLYIALGSGLVAAAKLPIDVTKHFLFFLTFAFIAGFSERFARDTLTSIGAGPSQAANAPTPEDADAERKSSSASRSP
jgi:hypothetical protein